VVLATDLDGTLAHGDPETRARLIELLRSGPGGTLIYVTGRTPEGVASLSEGVALPEPDVLIADVGTSVLKGFGPERVDAVERELDPLWPGGDAVAERLAGLGDRLSPQDVRAPRRLSYWIEPVRRLRARTTDPFAASAPDDPSMGAEASALAGAVAADVVHALAGLRVDVLVSANVFLDVLPRGVHKGSTLRRVLDWLGAPDDQCVVAGDSLNDLSLFETGLRGIAVGNCEPALRERVAGMERVYQAGAEGVAGVLEGLRHHGFVPDAQQKGGRRAE
jgi:hydroxymethylpyrimidine pyrophosphatase-like HAD family hydrolase